MSASKNILYTIQFSHYCELARWSLQSQGKSFTEVSAIPIYHMLALPKNPSGGSTVPHMHLEDGSKLTDSWAIASYCFPDQTIDPEVQSLLNKDVGISTRAIYYHHNLGSEALNKTFSSAPWAQKMFYSVFGGIGNALMRKSMVRSPEYIESCTVKLDNAVKTLEEKLKIGEEPDSWDMRVNLTNIAVASLLAPVVNPSSYALGSGMALPEDHEYGEEFKAVLQKYRGTNLGKFTLHFYELHRSGSS